MKKFFVELLETCVVSLLCIPMVIIGMATTGFLWSEKVEPWLKKKFNIS